MLYSKEQPGATSVLCLAGMAASLMGCNRNLKSVAQLMHNRCSYFLDTCVCISLLKTRYACIQVRKA